jgi:hypothetical protein
MTVRTTLSGMAALAGALVLAACGSEPAPAKRVFFVEPADGATVKSPVKLKFGIEGYELSPVPAGEVTAARPNVGHHHVGVDTECLPPGTVIPKAAPWVHFGKGDAEIDMQLTPGSHKLALELGDDMHTTIAGLCTTITVNVAQ